MFPDGLGTDAATLASGADIASALLTLPWHSPLLLVPTLQPLDISTHDSVARKTINRVPSAPELAQPMHRAGRPEVPES